MTKEELMEYLKEALQITVYRENDFDGESILIELSLEGETFSKDSVSI